MKELNFDNISKELLKNLNKHAQNIVNTSGLNSPRTIGDAVQLYLSDKGLPDVLQKYGISVKDDFSRRSMEDMAFYDVHGNYYAVDAKTHNKSTLFNMPNLISVRRLAQFYKNDDKNHFCILIVSYTIADSKIKYEECYFKPIEAFSWDCLTLGALGWGQIQIANASKLAFYDTLDRKAWMLKLCDNISIFYDEEINKINERKSWFSEMKRYWKSK